jgi:hypothetical protein
MFLRRKVREIWIKIHLNPKPKLGLIVGVILIL